MVGGWFIVAMDDGEEAEEEGLGFQWRGIAW